MWSTVFPFSVFSIAAFVSFTFFLLRFSIMCRRVFNKTIFLLGLAGYEMIITNSTRLVGCLSFHIQRALEAKLLFIRFDERLWRKASQRKLSNFPVGVWPLSAGSVPNVSAFYGSTRYTVLFTWTEFRMQPSHPHVRVK